jgi:site-specific recombinase XerD
MTFQRKEISMATLREKNGFYFVDYRVKGRRVRKSVGKSKRIAELVLKDIELKIARNEAGLEPKDSDLAKLFAEYLVYIKTHLAPKSQQRYRAIIDNFKAYLKLFPFITKVSQLNLKLFEDYQAHRKNEGAANKTINNELICLRAMFNLAIKWEYLRDNPTRNVALLKEEVNKKPRFLSKEECQILLKNAGEFLYPIFYTLLYTGMRKSELENLEWSDVDFERRKIKIRYKVDWSPKSCEREIPVNEGLFEILKDHQTKTHVKGCRYVFHRDGEKIEPNFLRNHLLPLTKKCGFGDVTKIHTLRHTFASHLVMSGVDLPTVRKLMGHADIETTMIYAHLADEHVDRAVERLRF